VVKLVMSHKKMLTILNAQINKADFQRRSITERTFQLFLSG